MTYMPIKLHPGFIAYQRKKTTAKDGPRIGASPTGRVKKSVVHAPTEPRAIHAMPIVPIIAAIGSAVAGFGIATAAGASIGAMIAGGAMMVGAALTVIGVVTENQKLMKIGGVLSLAGGVGALALGAMGGLTSAATSTAEAAAGAVPMAEMAGATGATGIEAAVPMADMAGVTANAASETGGILNLAGGGPGELASAGDVANSATQAASTMPVGEAASTATNPFAPITDAPMKVGQIDTTAFDKTAFNPNNSAGGGILDWMNKNKQATEMISGAVKGAAGMVPTDQSKANTALTKEQISALQLQQERDKRRIAYGQGKLYKGG